MKWLILTLVILCVGLGTVGKPMLAKLPDMLENFANSLEDSSEKPPQKAVSRPSPANYAPPRQVTYSDQKTTRTSRGAFSQLRNETSSAFRKNSTEVSRQQAMTARDLRYSNSTSLTQQRYQNTQALKQANGSNVSQSLAQDRAVISRELSSY